jgi:hypothetical protein
LESYVDQRYKDFLKNQGRADQVFFCFQNFITSNTFLNKKYFTSLLVWISIQHLRCMQREEIGIVPLKQPPNMGMMCSINMSHFAPHRKSKKGKLERPYRLTIKNIFAN